MSNDEGAKPEQKEAKSVKYTGTADRRIIDGPTFKRGGASDQKEVVWDASNKFTVPAKSLSSDALLLLQQLTDFKVS